MSATPLSDHTAIVTGAGSDVGEAIAEVLVDALAFAASQTPPATGKTDGYR